MGRSPVSALAAALVACAGAPGVATGRAPAAEDAASSVEAGARLVAPSLFSAGLRPVLTGWEQSPELERTARCAGCHAERHREWSQGAHASAYRDPMFQAAYAVERRAWCRHCHAPLSSQEREPTLREEGITCAACHVREGTIIGERELVGTKKGHPVSAVPGFGSPALCAGCHEFAFPSHSIAPQVGDAVAYSDRPMQATVSEWAASASANCKSCHDGGHALRGPSAPGWLAKQIGAARLTKNDDGTLSFRLEIAERGHSLPTGDLFHSFVLELATDPEFRDVLVRRRYGREFDGAFDSDFVWLNGGESRDRRVHDKRAGLTLTIDRPLAKSLWGRLRYFTNDPWVRGQWAPDLSSASTIWNEALTWETP